MKRWIFCGIVVPLLMVVLLVGCGKPREAPSYFKIPEAPFTAMMDIRGEKHEVRYGIDYYRSFNRIIYTAAWNAEKTYQYLWFVVDTKTDKITTAVFEAEHLIEFAGDAEGITILKSSGETRRASLLGLPMGNPASENYENFLFDLAAELLPQIKQAIDREIAGPNK